MEDSSKLMLQDGITKVLHHMITANNSSPVISSRFHSHSAPAMTIGSYVERIVKYTRCSCEALVGSLMFLQYHVTFSGHCITVFNVHRMLISSVVIAAKSRDDEYYTNTYYAKIGGIPASELKTLELDYINLLDWDCWLDRDAFEETVAMLCELSTSNPSADDIAQAVSFWQEKQSRFAKGRREQVQGAIQADIEFEARKVQMNQQQANSIGSMSFGSSNAASPSSGVLMVGANGNSTWGIHNNNNVKNSTNSNNNNGNFMMMSQNNSNVSSHQQQLDRLAFGGGNTPVSSSTGMGMASGSNGGGHRDPNASASFTTSTPMSASNSNLAAVVTAPCFYPKGMKAPPATGTSGSATKNLGVNPYQQNSNNNNNNNSVSGNGSPLYANNSGGSFTGEGYFTNPYSRSGNNNTNNSASAAPTNPFAPKTQQQQQPRSRIATPSASNNYNGNNAMFPSAPVTSDGNINADGTSQPRTPTSDNAAGHNKPASWASVAAAPSAFGGRSGSANNAGGPLLNAANSGTNNTTNIQNNSVSSPNNNNTSSPAVLPQGAPGFNTRPASLNANQMHSGSFDTPTASPGGNSSSNNGRLLTKHRFASGDSIATTSGGGGGASSVRTPESNRYSIVGVNTNQHPNSYHYYSAKVQTGSGSAFGIAGRGTSAATRRQQQAAAANGTGSRSTPSGAPGIRLTNSDELSPAAASSYNDISSLNAKTTSSGNTSNGLKSLLNASGGASGNVNTADDANNNNASPPASSYNNEEDDVANPPQRAGSKRGTMRHAGKKRELPANANWEQDER